MTARTVPFGKDDLQEGKPSRTAYRVALRRAAHQVFDDPVVFHDPLALRILGMTSGKLALNELRAPKRPYSRSLRAFVVVRSRFAEDTLTAEIAGGCLQYVLLGAGLDTFAYRNPWPDLHVFEVDHPATQRWKQELLQQHSIATPDNCHHVPVDFERDRLLEQLSRCGFRPDCSAVFAWLGVVPYLTDSGLSATLHALASIPAESTLVMDYTLPRDLLPPNEQLALDSLSARVAQAGEPFRQFFSPAQMQQHLRSLNFQAEADLDAATMNRMYFQSRRDGLKVLGQGAHLLRARKPPVQPREESRPGQVRG